MKSRSPKPKRPLWVKILIVLAATAGGIVCLFGALVVIGLNYQEPGLERTLQAGFRQKTVVVNGTQLNHGEGPDHGTPLLLIHGQMDSWRSYQTVLPELSKSFHIFAVDCHGHGKSGRDPAKYSAESMGKDFATFIETVIRKPAIVSGNSSGGLLALWLAAHTPKDVLGIVLEDPSLFSSEYPRIKTSVSWDGFVTVHVFLQCGGDDFLGYYVLNSHVMKLFRGGEKGIYRWIQFYRKKRPRQTVEVFFLPVSVRGLVSGLTTYDPRFGMTFYDGSWNRNFDRAQALSRVACPPVLSHANWFYDYGKLMGSFAGSGGMLMAAMDGEDATRAAALMKGSQLIDVPSGHCVHAENPKAFIRILQDFGQRFPKT